MSRSPNSSCLAEPSEKTPEPGPTLVRPTRMTRQFRIRQTQSSDVWKRDEGCRMPDRRIHQSHQNLQS